MGQLNLFSRKVIYNTKFFKLKFFKIKLKKKKNKKIQLVTFFKEKPQDLFFWGRPRGWVLFLGLGIRDMPGGAQGSLLTLEFKDSPMVEFRTRWLCWKSDPVSIS